MSDTEPTTPAVALPDPDCAADADSYLKGWRDGYAAGFDAGYAAGREAV